MYFITVMMYCCVLAVYSTLYKLDMLLINTTVKCM